MLIEPLIEVHELIGLYPIGTAMARLRTGTQKFERQFSRRLIDDKCHGDGLPHERVARHLVDALDTKGIEGVLKSELWTEGEELQ